jgi:hypothetical protein
MRKLNSNHQVWYSDGHKKISKTLKEMADAVKEFEREGSFVLDVGISQYNDDDDHVLYYTGTVIVDRITLGPP